MPRRKRLILPEHPHHLIQRGHNRQTLFHDDEDRKTYLRILGIAVEKHALHLHAYVLMDNHIHMLATPPSTETIAKVMQYLGGTYALYSNEKYERTGSPFDGRFRSSVVDTDAYLLTCYRYIEENPVRAGMCKRPSDHPWSSHGSNAHGRPDPLITPHSYYTALGSDSRSRGSAYRKMFRRSIPPSVLAEIGDTIERLLPLGGQRFIEELEGLSGMKVRAAPHGGDRRSKAFRLNKQSARSS